MRSHRALPGKRWVATHSSLQFLRSSVWPLPIRDVLRIDAELVGVALGFYLIVEQRLADAGSLDLEAGHSIDSVNCEAEAICLVLDSQFQGRIDVPLLLVTTHVNVVLAGSAIGEAVNQPWIGMEVEDDWLVRCEDRLELPISQTMRMLGAGNQPEEIDHIYESHFDVGYVVPQQG